MLVVSLVATLGFLIAGASVTHLRLMSRAENTAYALDLARSAAHLGIERIFSDRTFGSRSDRDSTLNVRLPGAPAGSEAWLTFDAARAAALGLPPSVNNLDGTESRTAADGQVVPTQSVYLVAEARCRGVSRQACVLLYKPSFPYAASSDGPIISSGGLQVASRDAATPLGTPVEQMKPADIQSNATGARAIVLGPNSVIHGDLRASGGIQLDAEGGTRVLGELWENQDPRALPGLRAEDYDPGANAVGLQSFYSQPTFTGKLRRAGSLAVTGDLELQGALLYVDGDLTVTGGLKGSGVVVTTGELTVTGQTEMTSADKVAVLSRGRISLQGQGEQGSNLRGVVYTEGGLEARRLRLEGALVSRSREQDVQLEQVTLLRDADASVVQIRVSSTYNGHTRWYMDGQHRRYPNSGEVKSAIGDGGFYYYMDFEQQPDGLFHYHVCSNLFVPGSGPLELAVGTISPTALGNPRNAEVRRILSILDLRFAELQTLLGGSASTTTTTGSADVVTVDPSQLLPLADSMRITLWRER